MPDGYIDVQHHIIPAEYVAAIRDSGLKAAHRADFPAWPLSSPWK